MYLSISVTLNIENNEKLKYRNHDFIRQEKSSEIETPEQMCSGISIYLMTFFLKNKKTVEKWKRWLYNTEIQMS